MSGKRRALVSWCRWTIAFTLLSVMTGFVQGTRPLLAAPGLGGLVASPSSLVSGPATMVTVSVPITGGTPVANGVNLLHVDAGGKTLGILGVMRDDGQNGDAASGDGTFTLTAPLGLAQPGTLYLQATAAFPGSPLRVKSPIKAIPVAAAPPTARPGGPYQGTINQPVSFDGTGSTAPSGQSITAYAWNFGDGSTGTGSTPTHAYAAAGAYQVSLTVTSSAGGTHSATTTATIAPQQTTASITGFSPSSGPIGTVVSVTLSNFTPSSGSPPDVRLANGSGGTISAPVTAVAQDALSFVVPAGARTGNITVIAGGQTLVSAATLTITSSATFSLTVGPSTARLIPGQEVTYVVNVASQDGFKGQASLTVTGVPSGVTAAFKPSVITAGQTSVLSLKAPANQATGTSTLSVTAAASVDAQPVTRSAAASLEIVGVTTSFVGRMAVDDAEQTPIAGVSIRFMGKDDKGNPTGCSAQTVSDAGGNFALTQLPAACVGPQLIAYDGLTATSPEGLYAGVNLSYTLTAGQVTASPVIVHLPRIDNAETVDIDQKAPTDQVFTLESEPSVRVTVYAGTTFALADGSHPDPFPLVATEVPVDRLPEAMPTSGLVMPFIVAFQPANAVASQPVAVDFPNSLNLAPGATATLMTLDPTRGYMVPYGTGTVNSDGTRIVPDLDPARPGHRYGITNFDWHGPATPPNDTNTSDEGPCGPQSGKPVDLSSGIEIITMTDIGVRCDRGSLKMTRTYRTLTTVQGPFGIGSNHNYGFRLNTNAPQTSAVISLIMPDGNQIVFSRQSGGVLTNETTPSMRGAVLATSSDGTSTLTWKNGGQFRFAASTFQLGSVLTSMSDVNGNVITLTRDSTQPVRITAVTDAVGRKLTIGYDSGNRIITITDPVGRIVRYTYNGLGTLATVTYPNSGVTRYDYDAQNRLTRVTDANGQVQAENSYDANGRVSRQVAADGGVTTFEYTLVNQNVPTSPVLLTKQTDALGNVTTYRFNAQGYVVSVTDALGAVRIFEREAGSNLLLALRGAGACPVCGPTTAGDQTYTYDTFGNRTSVTDALGNTTRFTHDSRFNKLTSVTDAAGHVSRMTYDDRGNTQTITDANGRVVRYTYDAFGLVTETLDPAGGAIAFEHDAIGHLVSTTDQLGNATRFTYDGASRKTATLDALSRQTSTEYDSQDRVVAVVDGEGHVTRFVYDLVGNLTSITDARNKTVIFTYDAMGRLLTRRSAAGRIDTRTYDFNGNLVTFVDRRSQTSRFTYDRLNRLVKETYPDATVEREYDAAGRLATVTDSIAGVFTFSYDDVGRLVKTTSPTGTVQYTRDAVGRVVTRQVAGLPPVTFTYDDVGNLLSASMPGASVTQTFDVRNQVLTQARSNGVNSSFSYDVGGRLLSISHAKGAAVLSSLTYSYDKGSSRVASTTNSGQPLTTQAEASQVDDENRLLQRDTATFTYDANGNRLTETTPAGTIRYEWDSRNRLKTITFADGTIANFRYDTSGLMISETVSGPSATVSRNFVLDQVGNVVAQSDSAGVLQAILSGLVIDEHWAVVPANGQVEFGLADALNSTVAVTSSDGTVVARSFFEPYGATTTTGSYPFQFTGRVRVSPHLYYYRARFYDSAGRFLSEDPLGYEGSGTNFYRYVLNDPVSLRDPSGEIVPVLLIAGGALIGGTVSAGIYSFKSFRAERFTWGGFWGAAAGGAIAGGVGAVAAPIATSLGIAGALGTFGVNFAAGMLASVVNAGIDPCTRVTWEDALETGFLNGAAGRFADVFFPTRGMSNFRQVGFPRTWQGVFIPTGRNMRAVFHGGVFGALSDLLNRPEQER